MSKLPTLIPLQALFGSASKRQPQLSPCGKCCAYLAKTANGVDSIFIEPIQTSHDEKKASVAPLQVTQASAAHNLVSFQWLQSTPPYRILYTQDCGGADGAHALVVEFSVNPTFHSIRDVKTTDLLPVSSKSAIKLSNRHPNDAIITLNRRNKPLFDVYRIDLSSGKLDLLVENPGDVEKWIVGENLDILGAICVDQDDAATSLRVPIDATSGQWKTIAVWQLGEVSRFIGVADSQDAAFFETTLIHSGTDFPPRTTDTSRLVLLSLQNGSEIREIAHDHECDIGEVGYNDVTRTVDFVVFKHSKPRLQATNDQVQSDLRCLQQLVRGKMSIVSRSQDNRRWLVADAPDNASLKYFFFDRDTKEYTLLFDSRPELTQYELTKMHPHTITTSDGEKMVVFMNLPLGVEPKRLPLIVNPHGGPWFQATWRFCPWAQWFANRGYVCLSMNFRGSTGYGKRWVGLGDGEWGVGAMQRDITDAVHWAIEQGYADPHRVGIYGGSYGGYAALAGLAFTPDLYACGVDVVGISNLKLFQSLESGVLKKLYISRMGDMEHDDELNERASPVYHTAAIRAPLLIGQGGMDSIVCRQHADDVARRLLERKHDVQYVLYPDEGHDFLRPANRLDFAMRADQFLAQHLGGRALPRDSSVIHETTAVEVDLGMLN